LFVKSSQERDRSYGRNDHSSFRNSGVARNQGLPSPSTFSPDREHLCILHNNPWKWLLLAVKVLRRAEAECVCERYLRAESSSLSESFDIDSSSAGLHASITNCMNLSVLQMNMLSELVLIERSKAHPLPGVGWLEPVVTPLSDWSSARN
jgi:hypothetical protein